MSYLRDKLQDLYTERADLLEQIQRQIDDPEIAAHVSAATAATASPSDIRMSLISAALRGGQISLIKEQITWVERQILAILGNPALVNKYDA